jgi:hypothetical protein
MAFVVFVAIMMVTRGCALGLTILLFGRGA